MRQDARRFLGFLSVVAFATGLGALSARAQELQYAPDALAPAAPAKSVGKKAKAAATPAAPTGAATATAPQQQGGKPRPDRQFGELEGWSPGKEPPKPKDAPNTGASSGSSMPVKVSPGGNMGTGFSF